MPPIGLEGHTVSLTKNGYFKLIELIRKYPANEILNHLDEIKLDYTQARKMLAGSNDDILPNVWDTVKGMDEESQYALLLFSIIFSHKDLIETFANSISSEMRGSIKRSSIETKSYTNLAFALNESGLATNFQQGADQTDFDLSPIFTKNEIGPLAKIILKAHLQNMGWREPNESLPFQRTFEEQVEHYRFNEVFGVSAVQFINWLDGKNIIRQSKNIEPLSNPYELVRQFKESLNGTGLIFNQLLVARFLGSLHTKPFVILTGLTGSGKTKLAQSFVSWICASENQYAIIPVGADWTNREPILGYPNGLESDKYELPDSGALRIILNAISDQENPHFLILDEMNLSHVERYFADFLSVMESKDTLKLYSGSIRKHGNEDIPERIYWPKNLFIIGTVNIDESTYMFSPKVLDRANVIEFRVSKEEMVDYLGEQSPVDMTQLLSGGITLAQGFLGLCQQPTPSNVLQEYQVEMVQIFDVLKTLGAEFGYRSASEIGRLIHSLGNLGVAERNDKIDIAIMQKMLPKLHGSRTKLHPVLEKLGKICLTDGDKWKDYLEVNAPTEFKEDDNVKYKLSFEKIVRMYKNASANGFASYAEA